MPAACGWSRTPEYYDVIVTTNMFGDIITDLGAMIQGGLGVAAGGNINPDPGGVSMFEPMGGSAPKYTGQNVINPIAAIGAMAMLLEHSGQPKAGRAHHESRQASHRHENEKPGRRQNGPQHQPSRRPRLRSNRRRKIKLFLVCPSPLLPLSSSPLLATIPPRVPSHFGGTGSAI